VIRSRTVRTTGVAESMLAELLADYRGGFPGVSLSYLPGQEGVDLRLTTRGTTPEEGDAALADGSLKLRERLGRYVYGEDSTDLAEVALQRARDRRLRIAVAESCTGGLLGARLTAIPGSSDVVRGGVIAYDNLVKGDVLGVEPAALRTHGAVSEQVALEMAAGVRRRIGAEIGVGITGVAGPGGGTPAKPVGTVWIAVDVEGVTRTYGGMFFGDRGEIRFRATQAALDMIRRALDGVADPAVGASGAPTAASASSDTPAAHT
jgi:nicotinamide-nucleotide amidase